MRSIIAGIGILLEVGAVCGCESREVQRAKLTAKQLAYHAYPQWAMDNPGRECPESLLVVIRFIGGSESDAIDPWGTPYEMLCGKNLPPGVRDHFAVLSYGPDRQEGTDDDIKSWEPR